MCRSDLSSSREIHPFAASFSFPPTARATIPQSCTASETTISRQKAKQASDFVVSGGLLHPLRCDRRTKIHGNAIAERGGAADDTRATGDRGRKREDVARAVLSPPLDAGKFQGRVRLVLELCHTVELGDEVLGLVPDTARIHWAECCRGEVETRATLYDGQLGAGEVFREVLEVGRIPRQWSLPLHAPRS